MDLLVRGGTIICEEGPLEADLLCRGGKIAAILDRQSGPFDGEVLDATGLLIFPGFIDPHVHSRDPGATHKETFAHSTLGALCGGVTTLLEMPNAVPAVADVATFHARRAEHEPRAWVDFGLWGLALGPANVDDVVEMFEAGAVAVKFFWGYALDAQSKSLVYNPKDGDDVIVPPENGEVLAMFARVARTGGVLAAHCEDRHVLASALASLNGRIETYDDLLASRPAVAEATSIAIGAEFAKQTGCRFHVVHMGSADGTAVVRRAQADGIPITAETCPQYLTLSAEDAERLGPMLKVYPPVRDSSHQEVLWAAVNDGTICSIGSDHAPHLPAEKMAGGFGGSPAGGLGVETLAPLLVDAMVNGTISPERLAAVLSTATAKLYGLHPRKGAIRPGADADLSLVDPAGSTVIENARMHALNPVTAWDGAKLSGRVVASVLRGELAMRDGEPVGERRGRFITARHARPGVPAH